MLRAVLSLLILLFSTLSFANDLDKAWEALNRNDRKAALQYLQKAKQDPAAALDAILTEAFLQTFEAREREIPGFINLLDKMGADKNAYLFALWFKGSVAGEYTKKKKHQLDLLLKLIGDPSYNGSIQSAAHYVKAMHHVFSNEIPKAREEWGQMGALFNWQLAGPFENISGTGFHTKHGPLESPAANSKFTGLNNIEVGWFTPPRMNNEGWIFPGSHIRENTAVVYAQTFVYSPGDLKALVNVGGSGSLKVWVNDVLVISESKGRVTELDCYKNYCTLNKGYNRVLVQLGSDDNSFSNFIVRLTDENFHPIKDLKTTSETQPYKKGTSAAPAVSLKHFAEDFFEKKIAAKPNALINYLLLSQVYLRNEKTNEARQVLEKALALAPENSLIRFELIQCLMKAGNRPLMLQEIERIKEKDPKCLLTLQLDLQQMMEEEKYEDAAAKLEEIVAGFGKTEYSSEMNTKLLANMGKYEELLKAAEQNFNDYPGHQGFLKMMFHIKKEALKDAKGALEVYEKYLDSSFHINIVRALVDEYTEQGLADKQLDLLNTMNTSQGYDPKFSSEIANFYFAKKNYAKALEYAEASLKLAPYESGYWSDLAAIYDQMNNKPAAINSYKKAIYYNRTNYDAYKKLAMLEQKPDTYKLLPQTDIYDLVKKAPQKDDEHNFAYLIDEKSVIIYGEGASEEYVTYAVKLYNQKAIDSWKEITLSRNWTQSLMVEKAEVIKPNGSKVPAERNEADIVFTNLEPGDAIYVRYRLQNYSSGRMGREFWDKFMFEAFQPTGIARYCIITPKSFKFNTKITGGTGTLNPVVKEVQGFKMYTWEMKDIKPLEDEPLMPGLADLSTVLHVSTLNTWSEVAEWYSSVAYQDHGDDFELNNAYQEIFAGKKGLSDLEKARLIYNYIVRNIQYSSVPFRQSGLVPQPISKIITTRLGDCKDVSSLFVALAGKAGLKAQLVLVDTRDNGTRDMVLPSVSFNHCIVKAMINGKDHYLELTDRNLPFGSHPSHLYQALSLDIPAMGQSGKDVGLKPLVAENRTLDQVNTSLKVKVDGRNLQFDVLTQRKGNLTTDWRQGYATTSPTDLHKEIQQSISGSYKNPVKLNSVKFMGLEELADSVTLDYSYSVKNEVIEAGSMKMIKIPLLDVVASIDNLSLDKRQFPVEYWRYENTDVYESNITVELQPGQKFLEVPEDQSFTFNKSVYQIKYTKVGDALKVRRYARLDRSNVLPADYEKFKKFFNDIIEAESKYIVFK